MSSDTSFSKLKADMAFAIDNWISPEEYLARELQAEHRSEYVNGRIYAMAGASRQHSQVTFNLAGGLGPRLRGDGCRGRSSDQRVLVSETGLYTYPHLVVVCGEPEYAQGDTLTNPTVIFEVLSPRTEAYDRGEKFEHYRRLESLQEYVLVAQDRVHVEHFQRQGDVWMLTDYRGPEAVLHLEAAGCDLPLSEIYEQVEFEEEAQRGRVRQIGPLDRKPE